MQSRPLKNGPEHVEYSILSNVMGSSTEAELGGSFENFQKEIAMITDPANIVHQEPPTPVATENTEANSIVNGTAKQKISREIDMIFYWVIDRIRKNISTYSGNRERKTYRIMSRNTTQSGTIEK